MVQAAAAMDAYSHGCAHVSPQPHCVPACLLHACRLVARRLRWLRRCETLGQPCSRASRRFCFASDSRTPAHYRSQQCSSGSWRLDRQLARCGVSLLRTASTGHCQRRSSAAACSTRRLFTPRSSPARTDQRRSSQSTRSETARTSQRSTATPRRSILHTDASRVRAPRCCRASSSADVLTAVDGSAAS